MQTISSIAQSEKNVVSLPVKLLYLTKDTYFIETKSGARISIKADIVKSVVWLQALGKSTLNKSIQSDPATRAADAQR